MRPKSIEKQRQLNTVKSVLNSEVVFPKMEYQENTSKKYEFKNVYNSGFHIKNKVSSTKSVKKTANDKHDKDMSSECTTEVNNDIQEKRNCRLCNKDITGKECQLLYDEKENVETRLGRKINVIINSNETELHLSQYCCSVCTSKIEICFSLLVEIQASNEVIKKTYEHLSSDGPIDISTQVFICGDCKATVTGIKSFIRHYENHILKKTVVNSTRDIKLSQLDSHCPKHSEEIDNTIKDGCIENILKLNSKRKRSPVDEDELQKIEKNLCRAIKFDKECKMKQKSFGNYGNRQIIHLTSDEFCDENIDVEEHLIVDTLGSDNSFTVSPDHDDDNNTNFIETFENEEKEKIYESETSTSSDTSYKKLVSIVKRELEKSDSEDDPNMEIMINEKGNYYCSTCNQSFEYKFLLVHHYKRDHKWHSAGVETNTEAIKEEIEDDGYVLCPYCQNLCLLSEVQKHMTDCIRENTESDQILCHTCGKLCTHKQWGTHKKKHMNHAGMWACELCGKRFKAKRILRSHLGEHDESKKKICEICGKKLLPLSFFSHMMKHKEKRHVCPYCGKGFTYNYGLRMHLKIHEGSERLEAKFGKKKDKVFCWLCKKDFDSSSALRKHLKNLHNIEGVEQDSRFSCSECDKKFADMFGLKAHLKLIHEMKDEEIARFKSLPVYRYIECNVCNQVFNSENKVRIHMKQDHGLKPFEMEILKKECEKCGKRFASKQNLIHHINGAHLNIKPMQCDICNERFAKHSSLIYHKLRHSGEKPFQCEYCHKTYRQRNDVIRHLARHVRDHELTLEEASAINNSPSPLVLKRRIFLKDSSISYQALVSRNRRQKPEIVEGDQISIEETKIEIDDGSLIYVEEVMADEVQQPESPTEVKYMTVKPVYNEERNTIILSSPELFKNAMENVSYRYVTQQLKDVPAVIVKKETNVD